MWRPLATVISGVLLLGGAKQRRKPNGEVITSSEVSDKSWCLQFDLWEALEFSDKALTFRRGKRQVRQVNGGLMRCVNSKSTFPLHVGLTEQEPRVLQEDKMKKNVYVRVGVSFSNTGSREVSVL